MYLTFIIHLFATFFMTGLCWFVQIAHYPLFHEIDLEDFPKYEQKNAVTAYVTVPVMIIELITALILLYFDQSYLAVCNLIFIGIISLSTMIFQVPMHLRLMKEASHELISELIISNWIRTLSWTVRSVLLGYWLLSLLNH